VVGLYTTVGKGGSVGVGVGVGVGEGVGEGVGDGVCVGDGGITIVGVGDTAVEVNGSDVGGGVAADGAVDVAEGVVTDAVIDVLMAAVGCEVAAGDTTEHPANKTIKHKTAAAPAIILKDGFLVIISPLTHYLSLY
jgi:hypothetical protein